MIKLLFHNGLKTNTSVALPNTSPGVVIASVNMHTCKAFCHHSYFSDVAVGVICGFGAQSYKPALQVAERYLAQRTAKSAEN
jgi:3-dehydroquinate dehydratase-2